MTTLYRCEDTARDAITFSNGSVEARVNFVELRSMDDWDHWLAAHIPPLVWLSMPVHDQAAEGEQCQ